MKITNKIGLAGSVLGFALLFAAAGGCSSGDKAGSSDMYDHGDPVPASGQKAPSKMVFEGPGKMLAREVGEWKIVSAPRYFGPDNLYDLINGGAEIYVEFGLKKMVTAEYRETAKTDLSVTVEIYDMGSVNGAFGRMARFLTGRIDPADAGKGLPSDLEAKGIMGGTDIVYFKGSYLVHLTMIDESPSATLDSMNKKGREILPVFAAAMAANIASDAPIPAEFSRFPAENRIGRTEAFEPKAALGLDGLGPGFTVRYAKGDTDWSLFVTEPLQSEALAQTKLVELSEKAPGAGVVILKKVDKRIVGLVAPAEAPTKEMEASLEKLRSAFVPGN